ncbi:MAG: hypothetical protein QOF20_202, partial [Acidimicrobiaceae bacterium]|nr:hypothetical protein [Acidimicrobiaceae bacterium]
MAVHALQGLMLRFVGVGASQ